MNPWGYCCIASVFSVLSLTVQAGVVITGTRVIYPETKKEVTVSLKNTGMQAALVKSWIDTGDPLALPEKTHVPFVLTPPITRLDKGKGQALRLLYTGEPLPTDRESIFWLNVLTVPPKIIDVKHQYLNVAYQTRIKLIYRPVSLIKHAQSAAEKLQWKKEADVLNVYNPTPYYISLLSVEWLMAGQTVSVQGEMLPPFEQITLAGKNLPQDGKKLNYSVIDDLGIIQSFSSVLSQ